VNLADRVRDVLRTPNTRSGDSSSAPPGVTQPADHQVRAAAGVESILGGEWRQQVGGACFVVDSRRTPETTYRHETIGAVATRLEEAEEAARLLAGAAVPQPFLFFDLETTGLSGGAGTYVFLIGCGWFEQDGAFAIRQYVLMRIPDERLLLGAFAPELERAGTLISFNGKSFDAPLLETRYLYHRLRWTGADRPHLDMLHVARRFWGGNRGGIDGFRDVSCSLLALERQILGVDRPRDVPGFDIPSRYFRFVRTGDPRPLKDVLEHNRQDLLSLAALTTRAMHLVRTGPDCAAGPREALALGYVYARAGLLDRACSAYRRAMSVLPDAPREEGPLAVSHQSGTCTQFRIAALHALARCSRRARRYDEAARYWQAILDSHGCTPHLMREAGEALAIHHEHRRRDLPTAKFFALRTLDDDASPARNEAARYRLARIDRKMSAAKEAAMFLEW
jgi:uncharacterized protein YprB with RNaseH-like and TPR domain